MTETGITQPRGWFNEQETSNYPLTDSSKAPRAILVDLSIASPDDSVYVDSLFCGDGSASIVLNYSGGLFGAITVASVVPGRVYEFTSSAGSYMIVFGKGAATLEYRNTEPLQIHQSCLHRTFGRAQIIGVPGAREPGAPLRLTGADDVSVRRGFLDKSGTLPALFLGLNTAEGGIEVHDRYLGPCDRRPVSLNCQGDQPIRTIGAVPSDCCNTIYIELQGVAIRPLDNYCGIAVDSDFTLEDSCPPRELVGVVQKVADDCETPSDDYLLETGGQTADSTGAAPPGGGSDPAPGDDPGNSDPQGSLSGDGGSAASAGSQPPGGGSGGPGDPGSPPPGTIVYDVYDMAMLYDSYNRVYGDSYRFDEP